MIIQTRPIPTGYLFTSQGSRGEIETLSIGITEKSTTSKQIFLDSLTRLTE